VKMYMLKYRDASCRRSPELRLRFGKTLNLIGHPDGYTSSRVISRDYSLRQGSTSGLFGGLSNTNLKVASTTFSQCE